MSTQGRFSKGYSWRLEARSTGQAQLSMRFNLIAALYNAHLDL